MPIAEKPSLEAVFLSHISEKPWSSYTKADYTPEQWHRACLIHQHQGAPTSKGQCKLPVRTPNGAINRNGVHAAAAALAGARGGVDASDQEKASARTALVRLYSELGEDVPSGLIKHSDMNEEERLIHFGVKGMKWGVRKKRPDEEARKKYFKELKRGEYSTEGRVIKKGEKLQNVSAGQAVGIGDRRVFVSRTAKDNAQYRSTYARTLQVMSDNAALHTNTLVATKNLKVASEKAAYDAFKKMYDKDPAGMTRALAMSYEGLSRTMLGMSDVPDTKLIDSKARAYSKKGEDWVRTKGYDLFTTGTGTDMLPRDIADRYYTNLAREGYHAVRDHTDVRAKMADDPIVILRPKGSVALKDTVPLTEADIKLARSHYKEHNRAERRAR
jgi:hypothetical protein